MTNTMTMTGPARDTCRFPLRYVGWGALAGLAIALAATFVSALFYGNAQGMTPGNCVVFGCMFTLILSQMTGFPGIFLGAAIGACTGAAVHLAHRARRGGS